ncbi:MAG TPA: hypothetical protein VLK35_09885 [Methylomirabilota bacterium]|nr:hypothetical protein [Methylomirabilota bacterium]
MGARGRPPIHCCLVLALGLIAWSPIAAAGAESEIAGMITEIHVGRGRVEVVSVGGERRRPATPLLTLRDGEAVAITGDAWVVVVLTGARGTVRVDESTSPFVVTARPAGRGRLHKGLMILEASFEFLSTTSKDSQLGNLGSRGGVKPPIVLTPRNGRVLPDSVSFEWRGSRSSRYGIRIVAPEGVILERADVAATRFDYPKDAAPLRPGVRYTFQLLPAWHPPQEVWFDLVHPEDARTIHQELQALDAIVAGDPTAPTAVILRAALLARRGLLHDARLQVTDALTRRPEEPTLHFLLGELTARQGLPQEAMEAFAEARFLLSGPAAR